MTDISNILPFEAFVVLIIATLGLIACWPSKGSK